jgi:hypothetical protein
LEGVSYLNWAVEGKQDDNSQMELTMFATVWTAMRHDASQKKENS